MRILVEDTMALIVDLQERLMPVIHEADVVIHNSSILVQGLKALGVESVVTQQYTKGIGMTVPQIMESYGDEFSYFDKVTFSCAEDPDILNKLQQSGKRNIIVCGAEAHICVLQTVIDLIAKGYHVILVEDCIGSRKVNDKAVAVKRAIEEGATISTYESILFELTRVAKTDVFKIISKLIK